MNDRHYRLSALEWVYRSALPFYNFLFAPMTLGVRAIVEDRQGRILLVRHTYVPGWHFPGGGLRKSELAADAARREVLEETGVVCAGSPKSMLGIYGNFRAARSDHVIVYVFDLQNEDAHVRASGWEIAEAAFFHLHELPAEITPATRRRIAEWKGEAPVHPVW